MKENKKSVLTRNVEMHILELSKLPPEEKNE